jgi:hypothetical protein
MRCSVHWSLMRFTPVVWLFPLPRLHSKEVFVNCVQVLLENCSEENDQTACAALNALASLALVQEALVKEDAGVVKFLLATLSNNIVQLVQKGREVKDVRCRCFLRVSGCHVVVERSRVSSVCSVSIHLSVCFGTCVRVRVRVRVRLSEYACIVSVWMCVYIVSVSVRVL